LLPEPWPLPIDLALTAVFLATVVVAGWLIGAPTEAPADRSAP